MSQLVELEVSINFSRLSRQHPHLISLLLQKHAWRQCFPKLQNLKFGSKAEKISEDFIQEFAAQFCAGIEVPDCKELGESDSALTVGRLSLGDMAGFQWTADDCQFFTDLCPNMIYFCVSDDCKPFLPNFFERLTKVVTLEFPSVDNVNLDCLICGIHPEEADALGRCSVNYLRKVHIVPVRPPLSYLTRMNLLSLRVFFFQHISVRLNCVHI